MITWLNTQVSEHKFSKFKPPTIGNNINYSNAQSNSFMSSHSPLPNYLGGNSNANTLNVNKNYNSFTYQSPFKPSSRPQSPSRTDNLNMNITSREFNSVHNLKGFSGQKDNLNGGGNSSRV